MVCVHKKHAHSYAYIDDSTLKAISDKENGFDIMINSEFSIL